MRTDKYIKSNILYNVIEIAKSTSLGPEEAGYPTMGRCGCFSLDKNKEPEGSLKLKMHRKAQIESIKEKEWLYKKLTENVTLHNKSKLHKK